MTSATGPTTVSVEDLMTRGYFPDRVIPPVNSLALSVAIPDILAYTQPIVSDILRRVRGVGFERTRCATHSVPKRKHLRRTLSIPNPLHQCILSAEIASNWQTLEAFCAQSPLSLSVPKPSIERALEATNGLNKQPIF